MTRRVLFTIPVVAAILFLGQINRIDYTTQIKNNPSVDVRQFSGADIGVKINACVAALPSAGGTCDARGFTGAQSTSTSITLNKPVRLLLGPMTLSTSASPAFAISADGVEVSGMRIQTTVILTTSATADVFNVTGRFAKLHDLTTRASVSRTGGASFHMARDLGTNSVINDVRIEGTYNGIQDNAGGNIYKNIQMGAPQGTGVSTWNAGFYLGNPVVTGHTVASTKVNGFFFSMDSNVADAGMVIEGGVDTVQMANVDVGQGGGVGTGLSIRNTITGTANTPRWFRCTNCAFEAAPALANSGKDPIDIGSGNDIRFTNTYAAGGTYGLHVFQGNASFPVPQGITYQGGVIDNIDKHGVFIETDSDVTIAHSSIGDSSILTNATYNSIDVGPSASNVKIIGDNFANFFTETNEPAYNVNVETGAQLNISIINNTFTAFRTAAFNNGSSTTSIWIHDNNQSTSAQIYEQLAVGSRLTVRGGISGGYGSVNAGINDLVIGSGGNDPNDISMSYGNSGCGHNLVFGGNVSGTFTPGFKIIDCGATQFGSVTYSVLNGGALNGSPNGTDVYCSNCDTPAAEGNTCTSAGDLAGAEARRIRGVWKCF